MKKRFVFEFVDESAAARGKRNDGLSFPQYTGDEKLEVQNVDGVPMISGNLDGLLMLAKLCAKIAMSEYESGFHLHLRKDFNADLPEVLIVERIR